MIQKVPKVRCKPCLRRGDSTVTSKFKNDKNMKLALRCPKLSDFDVLAGRGARGPGNKAMNKSIKIRKPAYDNANDQEKETLEIEVINEVQGKGSFLKVDEETGGLVRQKKEEIKAKVRRAFRDCQLEPAPTVEPSPDRRGFDSIQDRDCLLGRHGDLSNTSQGNQDFRAMLDSVTEWYKKLSHQEKRGFVVSLIEIWKERGNRFMTKFNKQYFESEDGEEVIQFVMRHLTRKSPEVAPEEFQPEQSGSALDTNLSTFEDAKPPAKKISKSSAEELGDCLESPRRTSEDTHVVTPTPPPSGLRKYSKTDGQNKLTHLRIPLGTDTPKLAMKKPPPPSSLASVVKTLFIEDEGDPDLLWDCIDQDLVNEDIDATGTRFTHSEGWCRGTPVQGLGELDSDPSSVEDVKPPATRRPSSKTEVDALGECPETPRETWGGSHLVTPNTSPAGTGKHPQGHGESTSQNYPSPISLATESLSVATKQASDTRRALVDDQLAAAEPTSNAVNSLSFEDDRILEILHQDLVKDVMAASGKRATGSDGSDADATNSNPSKRRKMDDDATTDTDGAVKTTEIPKDTWEFQPDELDVLLEWAGLEDLGAPGRSP